MNGDNQQLPPDQNQAGGQWQFKPDGGSDIRPSQPAQPAPIDAAPNPAVSTAPEALAPVQATQPQQPSLPPEMEVSWSASEYVAHSMGITWYAMLFAVLFAVLAIAYLLIEDVVAMVIVAILAILVAVSSARKPRIRQYHVGPQGLTIGNNFYAYTEFKSFSIMDEGVFSSIMFLPMKRIVPPLSIYYDPEDEERIVATLSLYLPLEVRKFDMMDNLARRLRI